MTRKQETLKLNPQGVCGCCGLVGAYDTGAQFLCQICFWQRTFPDYTEHECGEVTTHYVEDQPLRVFKTPSEFTAGRKPEPLIEGTTILELPY